MRVLTQVKNPAFSVLALPIQSRRRDDITLRIKDYQSRALTGERSNRAVLDLALRRLIASKQKGMMIDGIAELTDLPRGLGSPVVRPGTSHHQP